MTAEIAVLNRFAVALAADSAVTIGDGSTTKIFQSENKLFQLSDDQPIAIMLYNATAHFGIPWELIVKDFREKHRSYRAATLFEIVPVFLDFLDSAYRPRAAQQEAFLRRILIEQFDEVRANFSEALFESSLKPSSRRQQTDRFFRSVFNDVLDSAIDIKKMWDDLDELNFDQALKLVDKYEDVFKIAFTHSFANLPLESAEIEKIKELAARALKCSSSRDTTTGLVFAGFGSKELFPSLFCMEIQGVLDDRLIKLDLEKVDIDRADKTGAVVPFAQREAADSLLYGRSDVYENSILRHFEDLIAQIGNGIVDVSTKSTKKRKDLKIKVQDACDEAIRRFRTTVGPEIKDNLFQDILDTIRHMPKQELASFAEALVSVTSIKRRISVGPETVGGPIDVAVISRHEGFVWVKRKLYFPAELNPRFAWRMRRAHDADRGKDAGVPDSGAASTERRDDESERRDDKKGANTPS